MADHCFWITERHENKTYHPIAAEEELRVALQSAIQAYRSQRQEALVEAIVKEFPKADAVSLSLSERMTSSNALENGVLEIRALEPGNARDKRVLELGAKVIDLVVRHRLRESGGSVLRTAFR